MKWMIPWCRSRARGSATIAPTWSRSVPLSSRKPLPPVPSPWRPAAGSLRLRLGPFRTGRVCGAHATPPSRGSCCLRRACRSVPGPPRGRGTLACAGGPAVFVPLVGVWAPALLVATVAGAAPSVHVQVSAPALGASGPVRGSELPARTVTLGCVEKLSRRFPAEAERAQCPRPALASAPRRARGGVSLRL